ncbi:GntR family transcriptional regulator [Paracoccus seriniphilus]|uniref:DNA-binding transcriptional regulator, GntR family n=1 Tax=Paracoccus seriniphilus TaxID=184748 RepID=A0A239PZZ8_9RHOB|nr:GntR family transcriptional regulator [Paracoccus seriniphilus]WCR16315.1 GntR family transcriptional regulator [Paracoccus seriniphilus]SNT75825.1 DNA-binding transcriptional regulator, GntR family [Paracoccus seriniphilus]
MTGFEGKNQDQQGLLSRLRFAILSLELVPGEPVSERALEAQFKVSRTPIREALFHLVRDGLVQREGRSYIVAPFDIAEVEEVFTFRDIVEPAAIRLATRLATPEEIKAIRDSINFSHDEFTPERWLNMGLDFHVRCAALSRNRCLEAAMQDVTLRTLRARWLSFASEEGRNKTHREHSHILDLIAAGDGEGAAKAVLAHSAAVREEVCAAIESARQFVGRRGVVDS